MYFSHRKQTNARLRLTLIEGCTTTTHSLEACLLLIQAIGISNNQLMFTHNKKKHQHRYS